MPINPEAVGATADPVEASWTSKDALLYAVGVGAGTNELAYVTENTNGVEQQVLPTFAVVVGWGRASGAVGQIGTEGDNAVAGVRKRLLQGGHHANAEGERQGIFEDGYVVVTKAAKKDFLDSSKALAMLAREPKAEALDAEWKKVEAAWAKHIAPAK